MKIALVLIPLLGLSAIIAAKVASRPATEAPNHRITESSGVAVATANVTRGVMEQTLSVTGVLRAEKQVSIGTKLPGRARAVLVKEGDRVSAGQLLVQLDNRDMVGQVRQAEAGLRAARAIAAKAKQGTPLKMVESATQIAQAEENVRAAESNLRAAELGEKLEARQADADLEKAQSGLRSAEAGLTKAKKGARPEEIARAEAGGKQAELGLEKAQRDFATAEKLYKSGGLTKRDFDDAQTGLRIAQEQVNDARAALKLAKSGATPEDLALADEEVKRAKSGVELVKSTADDRKRVARERIEGARTQVTLAKRQLDLAHAGKAQVALSEEDVRAAQAQVDQAQAGLTLAQQQVEETSIRTPVAGVVSNLSVHAGEMLLPGSILMNITSVTNLFLEANMPLRDLPLVRNGQSVTVTIDSLPGRALAGTVAEVVRIATDDNRSFKVRLALNAKGTDHALTPGAFARGTIRVTKVTDALIVPREALLSFEEKDNARSAKVFVIENGKALERPVLLGLLEEKRAQVLAGVKEGETVITAGAAKLRSGDRVLQQK